MIRQIALLRIPFYIRGIYDFDKNRKLAYLRLILNLFAFK